MNWAEIFNLYYTLYRLEAQVPDASDDEYAIALRLSREAIDRWSRYEDTFWSELYAVAALTTDGTGTYTAPTNMLKPAGQIQIGNRHVAIIDPNEAQFQGAQSRYAFFTGNSSSGYTLNLNPATNTAGQPISFLYFKKPTQMVNAASVPDMSNPEYIVHRMLAMRFRGSRNWTAYQTALRDSEDILKTMKLENDTGTAANPFSLPDRSGAVFGADGNSNSFWT